MTKSIDPARLKELRKREDISQQELAKRAKLTKGSLHRLETGRQPGNRQRTLQGLAKALGVEPGVLTGDIPLSNAEAAAQPEPPESQMNFRVNDAVRNAFWLASKGYAVPITRIVELVPFLFVCAAEASLGRRRTKLRALRKLLDEDGAILSASPHLGFAGALSQCYGDEAIEAEERSIAERKILADDLQPETFSPSWDLDDGGLERRDYDEATDNPFVRFLWEFQPTDQHLAFAVGFEKSRASAVVRRDIALEFCGGERDLADGIVFGGVPLYRIPPALLENAAIQQRIAWLRERDAESKARTAKLLADFDDPPPQGTAP